MDIFQGSDGPLRELALFAGAGGGILGGKLLGWTTVCAVERDAYARDVLVARQNDGHLDPFPIWDDVCTFDGRPWRGRVDVVSGGFPCQDISVAGNGAGIGGARSGLWREFARIIGEVRPRFAFVENSPALVTRGLGVVLGDLASLGYDARWCVLGARDAGAPHKRERIWIVAYSNGAGREQHCGAVADADKLASAECRCHVAHAVRDGCEPAPWRRPVPDELGDDPRSTAGRDELEHGAGGERAMANSDRVPQLQPQRSESDEWRRASDSGSDVGNSARYEPHVRTSRLRPLPQQPGGTSRGERSRWWLTEPDVGRVADGVAARVDRLRCLGNGQVPQQAALAWRTLTRNA